MMRIITVVFKQTDPMKEEAFTLKNYLIEVEIKIETWDTICQKIAAEVETKDIKIDCANIWLQTCEKLRGEGGFGQIICGPSQSLGISHLVIMHPQTPFHWSLTTENKFQLRLWARICPIEEEHCQKKALKPLF